ncbi:MAG: hypothetical protein WC556_07190 [Candidatus Methanoperedens sp.]
MLLNPCMKLVLRTGKKGMGVELFIVIILGLVFAIMTLGAAGKLQTAAEEKDYGDTMCRAALTSEDTLFNNSMEQSL